MSKQSEQQPKGGSKLNAVKKTILVLILVMMGVFVGAEKEQFYIEREFTASDTVKDKETGQKIDPSEIKIDGNQEIEQGFIARTDKILSVKLYFKVWEQKNGSGNVRVEVHDTDGTVLASDSKSVKSLVQKKSTTYTVFGISAELEKGKEYVLAICSDDLVSPNGCYLYGVTAKGNTFTDLKLNGNASDERIKMVLVMDHFAFKSMILMWLLLGASVIFIVIPFEKVPQISKWLARILFVASVPMAFLIVQRYSGYGLLNFAALSLKFKGIMNYFLFGLIWMLLYIICNRTKYAAVILVGVSSFLGLANYFVWMFRGIPIMAADISSFNTAMDVAESYEYIIDYNALWSLVYTAAFICVTLSLKSYKGLHWKKRICVAIAFLIPYGFFYTQLLHGTLLKDHGIEVSVWEPQRNYAKNGSLLSFFLSYTYYKVDKPANYSVSKAEEILSAYESDPLDTDTEKVRPNVIAIMNEAFSDLTVDGNLEPSEDFMPYIRNLSENTVKGNLYVSVLGGNTANTEFEFLTGCSMGFLPFRSIPYDTYVKDAFPSLTNLFKSEGYCGNLAIHPGAASSWSRDEVYQYFGFDEFDVSKDMDNKVFIRTYVSDESDYEYLISKYEETRKTEDAPYYVFNVTIQNHGGYSSNQGLIETPITITNDAVKNDAAEQYINLIKKSDDAFKMLTEYFAAVDEPTVIVMFGDHQPSLSNSFYDSLIGKSSDQNQLEDTMKKYTVPYIIWANYDIEGESVDMSANYLSAYLTKVIGSEQTAYQKYLLDLMEEVPAITANGYRGADGVWHELSEKSEYSDAIKAYQIVQYNSIFDSENRLEKYYKLAGEN